VDGPKLIFQQLIPLSKQHPQQQTTNNQLTKQLEQQKMKLDPTVLRTMHSQDFRVLEAVEQGMKNHTLVPLPLVNSIANLRHGGTHKIVSSLLRDKLLSHERKKNSYDGYRLTNAGYDIMALHNLKARGFIAAFGQRIGTGKESDVYLAASPTGQQIVLKIHRLGRTSFRNVKKKRDYFGNHQSSSAMAGAHSWLFLSRLSALKEYAFMKALYDASYPTPTPLAHNRHIVAMSLVRGTPLYQIFPKLISVDQAASIYNDSIALTARLAQHGLVHCDLNEFNILVDLSGIQKLATAETDDPYVRHSGMSVAGDKSIGMLSKPAWEQSLEVGDSIVESLPKPAHFLDNGEPKPVVTLIDFPQMISTKHVNAQEMYERDLACLRRFFEMKLQCTIPEENDAEVQWEHVSKLQGDSVGMDAARHRMDADLRASGFSADMNRGLELYYFDTVGGGDAPEDQSDDDDADADSMRSDKDQSEEHASCEPHQVIGEASEERHVLSSQEEKQTNCSLDEEENDEADVVAVDMDELNTLARDMVLERAKDRVRKQLEDEKRKSRRKGAFRQGNKNKTYLKGKRVMAESGF
jgi:RIO kinase 2